MSTSRLALTTALLVISAACSPGGGGDGSIVLYTSVTQETVDVVVAGFEAAHPGTTVEVFRAPTGELNARIAADRRESGMRADVLWLTDPLSMQQFDGQGLLHAASPDASGVPAEHRSERFWGTRVLDLVIVRNFDAPPISSWDDLITAAAAGGVAIPDPSLAGSAFAALAFFALSDQYGIEFLRALHDAGATQVGTPGDVVTGVAEGQYAAGITLDFTARAAVDKGSPIELVWPQPGAIAFYSPIAVTGDAADAVDFVSYVLGVEAQTAIATTGWQPVRSDVPWNVGGPQVTIPWALAVDRQDELLDAYRTIFGG